MNDKTKAALDKIKKLLRMRRGGTPDEVATALALAQEIATKHGIDLGAVNADDDAPKSERLGHDVPIQGARIQWEAKYAGLICQQFFKVFVFTDQIAWAKYRLVFVGSEWDRQIAGYVFTFLTRHFRYCWNHHSGRARNRQAFLYGMYQGVCVKLHLAEQLSETKLEGHALVLVERALARRQAYVDEHFGKMGQKDVKPDSNADAALRAGYREGQKTEIRPALKHEPQAGQLLLA